jgi:hypothetical protein
VQILLSRGRLHRQIKDASAQSATIERETSISRASLRHASWRSGEAVCAIDHQAPDENMDHGALLALRTERVPFVLTELKAQIEATSQNALPSSPLGKAASHPLRLWDKLTRFLDCQRFGAEHNPAENSMSPVVIAVETGPTSVTKGRTSSCRDSHIVEAYANLRSRYATTSSLSCQGSPTHLSRDFQNLISPLAFPRKCGCSSNSVRRPSWKGTQGAIDWGE